MNSSISQADPNCAHDISEICLLSPVSVGNPAWNHLDEAVTEIIDNIPKTIRTKFYSDLNIYEKNGQLHAYYIIKFNLMLRCNIKYEPICSNST
jgi:hypothetical protein